MIYATETMCNTKEGKHGCDDEMLKELDVLKPKVYVKRLIRNLYDQL